MEITLKQKLEAYKSIMPIIESGNYEKGICWQLVIQFNLTSEYDWEEIINNCFPEIMQEVFYQRGYDSAYLFPETSVPFIKKQIEILTNLINENEADSL